MWAIGITTAVIVLLPILMARLIHKRAMRVTHIELPSHPVEYHPSWRSFALSFATCAIGFVPILMLLASPNKSGGSVMLLGSFAIFFWSLGGTGIWMLKKTRVVLDSELLVYVTHKNKITMPSNTIRHVFISAGHIVVESENKKKIVIPLTFSNDVVLYAHLTELSRRNTAGYQ